MRTCQRKYHTRIEELPLAKMVNGKYELSDPYDKKRYVTCRVYGEMSDGTIMNEEEESYDNMPESVQGGEKGETARAVIELLEEAGCSFDDLVDSIRAAAE